VRRFSDREVRVLREAVGLEEAFLETGPTLEHPGRTESFVRIDACQEPPEHVVLLDDPRFESQIRRDGEDLRAVNHPVLPVWSKNSNRAKRHEFQGVIGKGP